MNIVCLLCLVVGAKGFIIHGKVGHTGISATARGNSEDGREFEPRHPIEEQIYRRQQENHNKLASEASDEDDFYRNEMLKCHPDEPRWADMFPRRKNYPTEVKRDLPDFTKLQPNDPLFLDMQWPEESGPEATAYAKHLTWKRRLTDSERLRWQKWAVYKRLSQGDNFDYAVEDFVFQNMLQDLRSRSRREMGGPTGARHERRIDSLVWSATADAYEQNEGIEAQTVVRALYSAVNRCNFDEIQTLWLPDDSVSLHLPGFAEAKGFLEVDKLWRRVTKEAHPFGKIHFDIVGTSVIGYIAVIHVVEIVGAGTALRKASRAESQRGRAADDSSSGSPKKDRSGKRSSARGFSTIVLRKWNDQWRVMAQHTAPFSKSTLAGDVMQEPTTAARDREVVQSAGLLPALPRKLQDVLKDGSGDVSIVSRINKNGVWERVSTIDENGVSDIDTLTSFIPSGDGKDEDDDDGNNDGVENGKITGITNVRGKGTSIPSTKVGDDLVDSTRSLGSNSISNSAGEISATKLTVRALRTLADVGSISKDEKDLLLADIIDKVSNDDTSLVEIAYELLLMRGQGHTIKSEEWLRMGITNEDGLEEFADQCHIICREIVGRA